MHKQTSKLRHILPTIANAHVSIQSSYTKTSKTRVTQYGKIQLLPNMHKISDITQQTYIEHAYEQAINVLLVNNLQLRAVTTYQELA